jgi:outer membrane protein TolC
MGWNRTRRWIGWVVLGTSFLGQEAWAQTTSLPAPLDERAPGASALDPSISTLPPAAQPIPGNAAVGLTSGGSNPQIPQGMPVNLATAMQRAGARPLDIAVAIRQVEQALAVQLQARALWIPNLNAGIDYARHDGVQQNIFNGADFQKGRSNLLVGGGPSLSVGLADAIFAPLAARRVVSARQADLQAARNDSLFAVAQAFFDVQQARGRILGTEATIARGNALVRLSTGLAPSLIAPLEVNRARTELQSLLQVQQVAIRDWRVASARLAEILLLEPSTLLEPVEPAFLQVTFVSADQAIEELMPVALANRPEIASRRELVVAAEQLTRQEKTRPLLPNLIMLSPSTSTGLLAAGSNSAGANGSLNTNGSRFDIEVAAVWQVQNGGLGNVGRIRQRKAEQDVASIELTRTLYRVKSELSQALARLQTARLRIVQTEEELRQAIESADKNFIGLRETSRPAGELLRLIVRPQEVVAAIMALNNAYDEYSGSIREYNAAQFEVYRALGQPAQWVTCQNTPAPTAPAPTSGPGPIARPARDNRPRR